MKMKLTAALASLGLLFVGTTSAEAHHCKTKGCAILKPEYAPCKTKYRALERRAKCQIGRAARHYGQSERAAIATARCESNLRWWVDSTYDGLFQFDGQTWNGSPYRKHSVFSAKWASLSAMWYWKRGERSRWPNC